MFFAKSEGDIDIGLTGANASMPLQCHFWPTPPREPQNCTVRLTPDGSRLDRHAGQRTRMCGEGRWPADRQGGSLQPLPRRRFRPPLEADMVASAVRIAGSSGARSKVVWTREEDMRHDVYDPALSRHDFGIPANGKIVAWKYRVSGSS